MKGIFSTTVKKRRSFKALVGLSTKTVDKLCKTMFTTDSREQESYPSTN